MPPQRGFFCFVSPPQRAAFALFRRRSGAAFALRHPEKIAGNNSLPAAPKRAAGIQKCRLCPPFADPPKGSIRLPSGHPTSARRSPHSHPAPARRSLPLLSSCVSAGVARARRRISENKNRPCYPATPPVISTKPHLLSSRPSEASGEILHRTQKMFRTRQKRL